MVEKTIKTDADVTAGAAWLAQRHPQFKHALAATGPLPLRLRDDGFEALLSAIVSQQISVAAARAIWAKLEKANAVSTKNVLALEHSALRALGLSNQKATYAKALAQSNIDFDGLRSMPTKSVIAKLTMVKGIGGWTAEIYAMFSLGRADVFAPGDLALQESARFLFDLPQRPTEKALRLMSEEWSPWRAVAARILWAYYHVIKNREGIT